MSFADDEIRDSIDAWREGDKRRLVYFIRIDAALTSLAAPIVLLVYLLIAREVYLLVCGLVASAGAVVMLRGVSVAKRGDLSGAVGWLTVGNWLVIFVGAVLAPAVWPIYPLAALLPAIVAASYVRQDEFRRYLIGSILVATITTLLGVFVELTAIRDDVPEWVLQALQATFVPLVTATIGVLALQNFGRIRSIVTSLSDAHDAMRIQANGVLASRARMLAATDRERRRIERDLHDGTQQHFVAMGMRLGAVKALLPADAAEARRHIEELREEVRVAQRDLRELTAAIYPATLSQHGLTSAVRFIADRFSQNVVTEIEDVGRCDPSIEAAVYFTVMEALQNASKHAGEQATVRVGLSRSDRELRFTIADDGAGFDTGADPQPGSGGTVNMHDRIGAVLGTLTIDSSPGRGTTVTGIVPVRPES